MAECIFCEIPAGRAEARVVYEDDLVVAFEDVQPQAPVHALVIPRSHLTDARAVSGDGDGLLAKLFEAAWGTADTGSSSTSAGTPGRRSTTPSSTSSAAAA